MQRLLTHRTRWALPLLVATLALLLAFGAWAQDAASDVEDEVDEEVQTIRRTVEEAADAARQAIESIPDPAQLLTQASDEALNQGTPTREEMFVYSLSPWLGKTFGGTFAPKQVQTLYLMEGAPSIVNAQRTEVYYWPITSEYMANWFEMREEVPGTLRIEQNGVEIATLERTDYAYYYPEGYNGPQLLKLGEEAVATYEDYQNRINAYYDSLSRYYEEQREWQRTMDVILREVRETGQPKDPSEIPQPPVQPEPPRDFAYQPRQAFAVDLPEGRYTLSLIDEAGNVVPESRRTLEVFAARRTGVGYTVLPEHKWTRRFESNDDSDVFYLDGTRVFYIVPHHAREFNTYKFIKMTNLHKPLEGEGTRSAWNWVQFDSVDPSAKLQVLKDGQVIQEISYQPFYVKQTPGYALGYEVILFDPENDPLMQGRSPTFEAYRVVLSGDSEYQLRFVDADGNPLPGSTRWVRAVKRSGTPLYAISLIPFGVGLIVFGWRWTKRSKGGGEEA